MNPAKKKTPETFRLLPLAGTCGHYFIAFISFLCIAALPGFSQYSARNAIYLEFASKGPLYSINYDRIIRQGEKLAYSLRAGFSMERNAVSFPVGFNFIAGNYEHHVEFGFTIIPYIQDQEDIPARTYADKTDKLIYVHPAVGYRFQKPERSVFLKASIGPSILLDPPAGDFWNMDPKIDFFGSVAAGISF